MTQKPWPPPSGQELLQDWRVFVLGDGFMHGKRMPLICRSWLRSLSTGFDHRESAPCRWRNGRLVRGRIPFADSNRNRSARSRPVRISALDGPRWRVMLDTPNRTGVRPTATAALERAPPCAIAAARSIGGGTLHAAYTGIASLRSRAMRHRIPTKYRRASRHPVKPFRFFSRNFKPPESVPGRLARRELTSRSACSCHTRRSVLGTTFVRSLGRDPR